MKPLILETDAVKSDYEKVLAYVKENPDDIRYASEDLRNNKSLTDVALKLSVTSYEFFGDKIKADPRVAFQVFKENNAMYRHFPQSLKDNEEFNFKIVQQNYGAIETVMDHKWRKNPRIMKEVVSQNIEYIRKVECDIYSDDGFITELIKKNNLAYFFFPTEVKQNIDLKYKLIDYFVDENRFLILQEASDSKDVSNFVKSCPHLYSFIDEQFKTKELSLLYVESFKKLDGVPKDYFKDKDFWRDIRKSMDVEQGESDKFLLSPVVKTLCKDKEIKKALNQALRLEDKENASKHSATSPNKF